MRLLPRSATNSRPLESIASNRLPALQLSKSGYRAVAEFEREMIRERVVAGLASAKHRGKQLGRRKLLFVRERVLKLYRAGNSIRKIAGELQINRGTIH